MDATPARTVLVTGFPLDVARRMARELVARGDRVLLLCRPKFASEGKTLAHELTTHGPGQVEVWEGDILQLDLGLAGTTVRQLHAEVDEIHHIAAISYLGAPAGSMRQMNVEGLREVLEVALGCARLQRICVWSTVFVAGDRSGTVFEDELMIGQGFRNPYEQTKADAEVLARAAMRKLPITIVRPSIIVGDSQTGELERLDGPYLLIKAIVHASPETAVPMPGRGAFPLPVVPIDYAVRAALYLTRHKAAIGGTFHLVDGHPLTARALFDAVADAAGRPRPTVFLPGGLARAVLNLPLVRDRVRNERNFLEWFDTDVHFDDRGARALLGPGGIECPPVEDYVEALVRHVREGA
jgi:nucleoside-diphosphate-sugar epimerase